MSEDLIRIVGVFREKSERFRSIASDQRQKLADYFESVSACLACIASALRSRESPDSGCADLWQYANMMSEILSFAVGADHAIEFACELETLANVRKLKWIADKSQNDTKNEQECILIDAASFNLKVLSSLIREPGE